MLCNAVNKIVLNVTSSTVFVSMNFVIVAKFEKHYLLLMGGGGMSWGGGRHLGLH
jgi:hypothetical protein